MKITYCNKRNESSTLQENQILFISFIINLKYLSLSIHSDQFYVLHNMCHVEKKFKETQ